MDLNMLNKFSFSKIKSSQRGKQSKPKESEQNSKEEEKQKSTTSQSKKMVKIQYEETQQQSESSQKSQSLTKMRFTADQLEQQNNFENIYTKIKEMRKDTKAPVDIMGCHANMDKNSSKEDQDFQLLVSLVLSVQSKDEKTFQAMNVLKEMGCTIENIINTDEETIRDKIKFVNFYVNKAKYIKKIAFIAKSQYKGKLPYDIEKLVQLPGVGYKIGVLFVNHATETAQGIGVDTHIHRIANRIGFVETKQPNDTMKDLESFVPNKYWFEINQYLVGFGQLICKPVGPSCELCTLNHVCKEGKSIMMKKDQKNSAVLKKQKRMTKKVSQDDDDEND